MIFVYIQNCQELYSFFDMKYKRRSTNVLLRCFSEWNGVILLFICRLYFQIVWTLFQSVKFTLNGIVTPCPLSGVV